MTPGDGIDNNDNDQVDEEDCCKFTNFVLLLVIKWEKKLFSFSSCELDLRLHWTPVDFDVDKRTLLQNTFNVKEFSKLTILKQKIYFNSFKFEMVIFLKAKWVLISWVKGS